MKRIHKIQTCIVCNGKRYVKPQHAAIALASATAHALSGPIWPEDDDGYSQAEFDAFVDAYEATFARIEGRAYPRFLKVCKRMLT